MLASEIKQIRELAKSLGVIVCDNDSVSFWPFNLIEALVKRVERLEERIDENDQRRNR